jgi:hypothetical protein
MLVIKVNEESVKVKIRRLKVIGISRIVIEIEISL